MILSETDLSFEIDVDSVCIKVFCNKTNLYKAYIVFFKAELLECSGDAFEDLSEACWYLDCIKVYPSFRRRRLATKLMAYAEKWLKDNKKASSIILRPSNTEELPDFDIVSFYERLGYERYRENNGFWHKEL